MTNLEEQLAQAYAIGSKLAELREQEKTAFISPLMKGVKFMFTGGHLGKPGSLISKLSPHHIGAPLGFGVFEAAMAEEGDKVDAFGRGVVSGLAFNLLMPVGGRIGRKLLAPGLKGTGAGSSATKLMQRLGFGGEATAQMQASRAINKQLHSGLFSNTQRALASGNYRGGNIGKALGKLDAKALGLTDDMAKELTRLKTLFSGGRLAATEQAKALQSLQTFSSNLYKSGFSTGSSGARAALKSTRFAKGLGQAVGGMGLAMGLSHPITATMDHKPASYFNQGGH